MFTHALAALTPDAVSAPPDADSPPSNQQIVHAAQSAYAAYQNQVDALASATGAYAADPAHADALAALAAYPWTSGRPSAHPVAAVVGDPPLAAALADAATDLPSVPVGVTTLDASHLGTTSTGMWAPTAHPGAPVAVVTAHLCLVATLSVDPITLAVGLWVAVGPPAEQQTGYGLVLPAPGTGHAVLAVALTAALAPAGFLYAAGMSLGAAAVAKTTVAPVPQTQQARA